MRILVATDAWHPQINGVVRTLTTTAAYARKFGTDLSFLTPNDFPGMPLPNNPEIKLALTFASIVRRRIARVKPDAIHIATEGPVGLAARRYCRRHDVRLGDRFPESGYPSNQKEKTMPARNTRFIVVGAVMIGAAVGFFLYMASAAGSSNDPQALMQTVGQVSGAIGGIGAVMIVLGALGRNPFGRPK